VEAMTDFFEDLAYLDQVDWAVIDHRSWRNTEEDPDRKRRKQADFLVYQSFPWSWIESIGVINAQMQQQVAANMSKGIFLRLMFRLWSTP
jgi:hypothetical protein